MSNNVRKEVSLDDETVALLEMQAKREGRKLKNYMEFILKEKANEFQLTEEYKKMMDELLERHRQDKTKYHSWEDVKTNLNL